MRIYQRKRVSEDEVLVLNTSVGIFDTDDGKARQFSIRTHPKSVQRRASSMLSQLLDGCESKLSLDDLERGIGTVNEDYDAPICSSPTDMRVCNGWCDKSQKPSEPKPQGPNVVRLVIHMWALSFSPFIITGFHLSLRGFSDDLGLQEALVHTLPHRNAQ